MVGLHANEARVRARAIIDRAIAGQYASGNAPPDVRAAIRHMDSGGEYGDLVAEETMKDMAARDKQRAAAARA